MAEEASKPATAIQPDRILGSDDEVVTGGPPPKTGKDKGAEAEPAAHETQAPPPKADKEEPEATTDAVVDTVAPPPVEPAEPAVVEPPSAIDEGAVDLGVMDEGELRQALREQRGLTNDLIQEIKRQKEQIEKLTKTVERLEKIAEENNELKQQLKEVNKTNEQLQDRIAELTGEKKAKRKEKWEEGKKRVKERLEKVKVKEWTGGAFGWVKDKFERGMKFLGITPSDKGKAQKEHLETYNRELVGFLEERRENRELTDVDKLKRLLAGKALYPQDLTKKERKALEEVGEDLGKWEIGKEDYVEVEKEREKRYVASLRKGEKAAYWCLKNLIERWLPIEVARGEEGMPDWRHYGFRKKGGVGWYAAYTVTALGGVAAPGVMGIGRGVAAGLNATAAGVQIGAEWAARKWGGPDVIEKRLDEVESEYARFALGAAAAASFIASSEVLKGAGAGFGAAAAANLAESLGVGETLRRKVGLEKPAPAASGVVAADTGGEVAPEAPEAGGSGAEGDVLSVRRRLEIEVTRQRELETVGGWERAVKEGRAPGVKSPEEVSGLTGKLELGKVRITGRPEGDTFWEALGSHLKGRDIGVNWVSPETKVTKTDVLNDFIKDILQKKGVEVDVVHAGDVFDLSRHLNDKEMEAVARIIKTKNIDEYLKLRPEIISLGQPSA